MHNVGSAVGKKNRYDFFCPLWQDILDTRKLFKVLYHFSAFVPGSITLVPFC